MKVRHLIGKITDERRYGHLMILFFTNLDKDIKDVIAEYQYHNPEYVDHLRRIMKEFGIKEEMINNPTSIKRDIDKRNIEDILRELSPQEIDITEKVLSNIKSYSQIYQYITEYILAEYPDIDTDKISNISGKIDDDLSYINFGERLYIYNKLDRPFVLDFYKKELNGEKYLKSLMIDDINIMLLSIHPDMNMKNIEEVIQETKEKLKDLKYEEKWLIYNSLAHILIQDLIGELEIS